MSNQPHPNAIYLQALAEGKSLEVRANNWPPDKWIPFEPANDVHSMCLLTRFDLAQFRIVQPPLIFYGFAFILNGEAKVKQVGETQLSDDNIKLTFDATTQKLIDVELIDPNQPEEE